VAIKVLRTEREADPAAARRLEREARTLQRLEHPHVVRVHEVGGEDDRVFIVMERLEGETLRDRLEREGRLAPPQVKSIVHELCAAIGEAHRVGIVHRDLKPANVFLTAAGVKVLDFGVAKGPLGGTLGASTKSGTLLGTPHYMSPEQATDAKRIDHRADLWAVGVIAYECLVGRRPFEGSNVAELAVAIATRDPPLPSRQARVPSGFDAWFLCAVARDPADRFESAEELASALEIALETAPRRAWARWVAATAIVALTLLALWLGGVFDPPPPESAIPATRVEPPPAPTASAVEPPPPTEPPRVAAPPASPAPRRRPDKPRQRRTNVDDLEF
jgi:serine/threonine-protein kinase